MLLQLLRERLLQPAAIDAAAPCVPSTARPYPCAEDEGGCGGGHEEEDHEQGDACCSPPAWVRLLSCLCNNRNTHMLDGANGNESGGEEDSSSGEGKLEQQLWQQLRGNAQQACSTGKLFGVARCWRGPSWS